MPITVDRVPTFDLMGTLRAKARKVGGQGFLVELSAADDERAYLAEGLRLYVDDFAYAQRLADAINAASAAPAKAEAA
jgi:hypothetical protein